jgi:hypothetical protein
VHRAFTSTDVLTGDALTAITNDAASKWVRDGKKYRILLPNPTTINHTLTIDNTASDSFDYSKVPLRQRVNQVTASFRNLDNKMKPDEQSPANEFAWQSKVGIVTEQLPLGSMSVSQMRRITRWRFKDSHKLPRNLIVPAQLDAEHLLVGDLVNVVDRQAGQRVDVLSTIATSDDLLICTFPGWCKWDTEPTPRGKSAALFVERVNSGVTAQVDLPALTDFPVDSYASFYVKAEANTVTQEVFVGVETGAGDIYYASYRLPQYASAVGVTSRVDNPPPAGAWVPMRFTPADIGYPTGEQIVRVYFGGHNTGSSATSTGPSSSGGNVLRFSELQIISTAPRTYQVTDIEDGDSETSGDRVLTLKEFYLNAYDVQDAFEEGAGGDPAPPGTLPPTIDTPLTFDGTNISGTIAGVVGTGTMHIIMSFDGGDYAEVLAIPSTQTSFSYTPIESGDYSFEIYQDGVTGTSDPVEISVTVTATGTHPDTLTGDATPPDEPPLTIWEVDLAWINHGATGSNIVERRFSATSSYITVATLPASDDFYLGSAPYNHSYVEYRVSNTSAPGYSNSVVLSTI